MANKELCKYIIGTEDIEQYAWHIWEELECDISEKQMEGVIEKLIDNAATTCESDYGTMTNFEAWLWSHSSSSTANLYYSIVEDISIAITEYIQYHLDEYLPKED